MEGLSPGWEGLYPFANPMRTGVGVKRCAMARGSLAFRLGPGWE